MSLHISLMKKDRKFIFVLNIEKYVQDKKKGDNYNYELICILTHIGPSGMAGHFIAFCKSPIDNNWYCYNDAIVSKCIDPRNQSNKQIEGIPYVLFYQKYKGNNENKITLFFKYNSKEFYLDTDKNMKFGDLINTLHNKYNLPQNVRLSLYREKENNYIEFESEKTINNYYLKNEEIINVVDGQ